jgi:hypothetical protein
MPNVPTYTDLKRQQRNAVNNRLSLRSVLNNSSPVSQSIAAPQAAAPASAIPQIQLASNGETVAINPGVNIFSQYETLSSFNGVYNGQTYTFTYIAAGVNSYMQMVSPTGPTYNINFGTPTYITLNGTEYLFYFITDNFGGIQ